MPKPVRRAIFAGLLLVVALAFYGVTSLPNAPSAPAPEFQAKVTPDANEQVPRQGRLTIELPGGFAGQLVVNQKRIPEEQLNRQDESKTQSNLQLIFQPGQGKVIEFFQAGQNCATFVYWRRDTPDQRFTKNWCFTSV